MNPLLAQFLSEARDFLQEIGAKVMQLEADPADAEAMTVLFRLVHTLKGNSGLFEFREMTRVLHAGEDLMDAVRAGRVPYSKTLADRLLDAMDFVGELCDDVERTGGIDASRAAEASRRADALREMLAVATVGATAPGAPPPPAAAWAPALDALPGHVRRDAARRARTGEPIHWVEYAPAEDCFFQGEDPLFQARQAPGLLWGGVTAAAPWPALEALDAYRCVLRFRLLSAAPRAALDEHFRYVAEQVRCVTLTPEQLGPAPVPPAGTGAVVLEAIVALQREGLCAAGDDASRPGRIRAIAATLAACLRATDQAPALPGLEAAVSATLEADDTAPLLAWIAQAAWPGDAPAPESASPPAAPEPGTAPEARAAGRADEVTTGARTIRVDQAKLDRLMGLIGEMVVSKNALPYLAGRAETVYGSRELAREIKAQHAIINRIAEDLQDAIMQVRMLPVSFVFQRFPRLVRDVSRTLGKEVRLVLEGEETEADKHIIESLADPLVHIVRNSLDHGIEAPAERAAAGKPAAGTLTIRASQQSDRVVIDIVDDGKGIDPATIRRKALAKGLLDAAALDRLSDHEAVQLVFAPGFSTRDVVSDLSGRGVGMDVVKTAIANVNGTVTLESVPGRGTRLRLSLPLTMAVTDVMVVEADGQSFGMPMDSVVEAVRVPRAAVRTIKDRQAIVLRDRVVPLQSVNRMLGLGAEPRANERDELAVLVVRPGDEHVGLLVDDVRESVGIVLRPMAGVLAGMPAYAGSALLGDGSVLMVLNPREFA